MNPRPLRFDARAPYRSLVGVGGIGTGLFFALEGDHTLGRNESRAARLLNIRDYCKLHIISHYIAVLLGSKPKGSPFRVVPIGNVGADHAGRQMINEMAAAGMDVQYVNVVSGQPTLLGVCFQYPDGAGGNITTSDSAASALSPNDVDRATGILAVTGSHCMVLAAPEVPLATRDHLLKLGTAHRALRVAAFASSEMETAKTEGMLSRVDLLAINEDEAGRLLGETFDMAHPRPFLDRCADALRGYQPHIRIIVSLGKLGAFAFADGIWDYRPAANVTVVSTAGAGDALLAGVLAGLAVGMPFTRPGPERAAFSDRPLESAFDFGMLLAAYSVTSPHSIHPDTSVDTLLSFASTLGATFAPSLLYYLTAWDGAPT